MHCCPTEEEDLLGLSSVVPPPEENLFSSPTSFELLGVASSSVLLCLLEKNVVDLLERLPLLRAKVAEEMFGAGGGQTRLRSDPTRHPLLAASKNLVKAVFVSAGS